MKCGPWDFKSSEKFLQMQSETNEEILGHVYSWSQKWTVKNNATPTIHARGTLSEDIAEFSKPGPLPSEAPASTILRQVRWASACSRLADLTSSMFEQKTVKTGVTPKINEETCPA